VVSSGSNAVVVYRTTAIRNSALSFAPVPQTLFVGTDPVSVTVADLNADGILDMLIANQDSNDVSVIFGSYDGNGDWLGIPGPRLKSGGDGPIAVSVIPGKGGNPDLAVINGGSGTITLLSGVGQGFFDDQHPQKLFDLGSSLVQPPTFVGTSTLGYAVTAGGELVRFDLADPVAGARVVFSGADVVAARALPSGDVVAAIVGGAVELLVPHGDGLSVAANFQALGAVPTLPSAVEVLGTDSGHLQVLVSSQGSDNIFVFSAAGSTPTGVVPGGTGSTGGSTGVGTTSVLAGQSAASVASQFSAVATAGSAASAGSGTGGAAAASPGTSPAAPAAALGTTTGTSLGGVLGYAGNETAGSAVLVGIQGNTYATVAILDFGSHHEEELSGTRQPGMGSRYPLGEVSPLMRFVTGQEEAMQQYRDAQGTRLPQPGDGPGHDPWNEDLFHWREPVRPPVHNRQEGKPMEEGRSEARLWDADLEALAILLAGVLPSLTQPACGQKRRRAVG
jgi:hypothetical protein